MKVVTWNCNGAFRKKYESIDRFDADIYIIQECENPELVTDKFGDDYREWAESYLWKGDTKNKGIGIFTKNGVKLERLDWLDNDYQSFLPCRVNDAFNMVGVWTKQNKSPTFGYMGQFWKYLQIHKEQFKAEHTLICGDFNSNVFWDVWDRWWNHSDVVRELEELGIKSIYHDLMDEYQGEETRPTLYLQRKLEKPYHIDYAFAQPDLFSLKGANIEVGVHEDWLAFSDHMPLSFKINQN